VNRILTPDELGSNCFFGVASYLRFVIDKIFFPNLLPSIFIVYSFCVNIRLNNHQSRGDEALMRILVVEDERRLAGIIRRGLTEEGYAVDTAYDGEDAKYQAENTSFDLMILDIMLPKKDGVTVCRELRQQRVNIPILMLTARDSVEDRVAGLDSGADDYLIKPFAFSELLARVRALLRREAPSKTSRIQVGEIVIDSLTREVWRGDRKIELTTREYSMLEYFMRHPNMVITRTMLEENVWDYEFDGVSNIIDVYIRKLRRNIDVEGKGSLIQTIRGAGYRLKT
jgi:DNA-binding response OmpR family regulator